MFCSVLADFSDGSVCIKKNQTAVKPDVQFYVKSMKGICAAAGMIFGEEPLIDISCAPWNRRTGRCGIRQDGILRGGIRQHGVRIRRNRFRVTGCIVFRRGFFRIVCVHDAIQAGI